MNISDPVRRNPLLQRLSPARRAELLEASLIERYTKHAVLFGQGERAESIWIVLKGWVHLVRFPSGTNGANPVVLFTVTPDEALVGISAIDSGVYQISAVAGTDCETLRIPAAAFNEALARDPGFANAALHLCARRLQHIAQQYGTMAEPVSTRIIRAILRLQRQFGTTLPVTHRELAQMAWTTTESAIRTVRALKRLGHLNGARGLLVIKRPAGLEQLLAKAAP